MTKSGFASEIGVQHVWQSAIFHSACLGWVLLLVVSPSPPEALQETPTSTLIVHPFPAMT